MRRTQVVSGVAIAHWFYNNQEIYMWKTSCDYTHSSFLNLFIRSIMFLIVFNIKNSKNSSQKMETQICTHTHQFTKFTHMRATARNLILLLKS